KKQFIGSFYAGFFTWVNLVTAIVQLLLVSRILKWFGLRVALFVLPLLALGGYTLLALAPIIGVIRTVKIAENSTDYSLQNTARRTGGGARPGVAAGTGGGARLAGDRPSGLPGIERPS